MKHVFFTCSILLTCSLPALSSTKMDNFLDFSKEKAGNVVPFSYMKEEDKFPLSLEDVLKQIKEQRVKKVNLSFIGNDLLTEEGLEFFLNEVGKQDIKIEDLDLSDTLLEEDFLDILKKLNPRPTYINISGTPITCNVPITELEKIKNLIFFKERDLSTVRKNNYQGEMDNILKLHEEYYENKRRKV